MIETTQVTTYTLVCDGCGARVGPISSDRALVLWAGLAGWQTGKPVLHADTLCPQCLAGQQEKQSRRRA